MKYRVRFYQNNLWEVLKGGQVYFRGNLAECYAWIQLIEDGFIDSKNLKPQSEQGVSYPI